MSPPDPWTPQASAQVYEDIKRIVAAHPDLRIVTTQAPQRRVDDDDDFVGGSALKFPVDTVIRLHKSTHGSEPQYYTHYVRKNRFPASFPDKQIYDTGFGTTVTKGWLRENVPEYSRVTFEEVTCNGMGWVGGAGRCVELQGQPVPGTMVIEHGVHRADLDSRTGIIVGAEAAPCLGPLNVMWAPWRFKDDP